MEVADPEAATEMWVSLALAVRIWSVEGSARSEAIEPSDATADVRASTTDFWLEIVVC
ncbi:MAG TPA: hypothetical protein VIV58_18350 [Kofleriaceae bacterium]